VRVGAEHFQLCEVAIRPAEDERAIAADEDGPAALQVEMIVKGFDRHFHQKCLKVSGGKPGPLISGRSLTSIFFYILFTQSSSCQ
jgi:hypothetical protein